jgi:hypothetical protein
MPSLVSGISYKKLVFKSNFGTTHETLYAHAWKRKCNYIKLQDLSNIQAFLCPTNLNLENVMRYAVEFFCAFHAAQLAISTQTCMFVFFTQEGLQIPSLISLLTFYPNLRKN